MGTKKSSAPQGLGALIRQWERVDSSAAVEATAARTAAILSRVREVPRPVLESIDRLMSCNYSGHGTAIFEIVQYLRQLEQLDHLMPSQVVVPRKSV